MLTIGEELLKVSLYQVVPRHDAEVTAIYNKADKHECFVALSEFDLVVLTRAESLPKSFGLHSPIAQFIRDAQETLAFSWSEFSSQDFPSLPSSSQSVAFTFAKLNPKVVGWIGLGAERALLDLLRVQLETFSQRQVPLFVQPYGTMGWSEMLLVWRAHSYKEITNAILQLREITVSLESLGSPEPLVIDTHTIPCAPLSKGENQLYKASSLATMNDEVSPTIAIASDASCHNEIIKQLEAKEIADHLPVEFSFTLGYYDLLVKPKSIKTTVSRLANLIAHIRQCPGVLSTQVVIADFSTSPNKRAVSLSSDDRELFTDTVRQSISEFEKEFIKKVRPAPISSESRIDDIIKQFPLILSRLEDVEQKQDNSLYHFAPNLAQIMNSFLSVVASDEMGRLIDDLLPFVEEMLRQANKLIAIPVPTFRRQIYEELEEAHLLYKFGFDQRLTGAQVGLANAARSNTALRPISIQRILSAVNSVPNYIFQQLPSQLYWKGFVLFGYAPYAMRYDEGIFNVPINNLLELSEWWFLNHEIGHELYNQLRMESWPAFQYTVERYCKLKSSNASSNVMDEEWASILNEELFAEYFSFATVCKSDWHIYLHAVWQFFQEYLYGQVGGSKVKEYLLRSAFVLACHLEQEEALARGERLAEAIVRGHRLQGNILVAEQDAPSYSAYQSPELERNLAYRGFAEYSSVSDLISREVVKPVLERCPHLAPEFSIIDINEIAQLYEVFENARSEIVHTVVADFDQLVSSRKKLDVWSRIRYWWKGYEFGLSSDELRLWKRLSSGQIVFDTSIAPYDLLMLLKRVKLEKKFLRSDNEDTRATIAVVLSLWHIDKMIASWGNNGR